MVMENSELEHLIVYLTVGRLLQEDQDQYVSEDVRNQLFRHYEKETPLLHRDQLDPTDYARLITNLKEVVTNWK
ncbi:MAG: hypothetical protein ACXW1D_05005 [Halobacteriota archaeon]